MKHKKVKYSHNNCNYGQEHRQLYKMGFSLFNSDNNCDYSQYNGNKAVYSQKPA